MTVFIKYATPFFLFFFIGLMLLETSILIYPSLIYRLTISPLREYILFPILSGLITVIGYRLLIYYMPYRTHKFFSFNSTFQKMYITACMAGIFSAWSHIETIRLLIGICLFPVTFFQIKNFVQQMKSFLSPRQYVTHKEVFVFFHFFIKLIIFFTLINFLFRIPDNPVISASEDMLRKRYIFYDSHDIYNALYFTVITITTVGFGDFIPISYFSKMIIVAECLTCYVMLGIMIGLIVRGIRSDKPKMRFNRSKNHFSKPQKQK